MDVHFRKAGFNDYEAVLYLFSKAQQKLLESGINQWNEFYPTSDDFWCDIESGHMFICESGGTLFCAAVLDEQQEPEWSDIAWKYSGGSVAAIHRLCVDPGVQGRGIGKKTVLWLEKTASNQKYTSIRLDAFSKNHAALALYASMGYQYAGSVTYTPGAFHCYEKPL